MKIFFKVLTSIIVIAVLGVGGWHAFQRIQSLENENEQLLFQNNQLKEQIEIPPEVAIPENTTEIIAERLTNAAEFHTINYICTVVDHYSDAINLKEDWNLPIDFDIPGTKSEYLVSYDGKISAGISNLSESEIAENEDGTITVVLPPISLFDPIIINDSMKIYINSDSVFNPMRGESYNEVSKRIKDKIKEQAKANNIEEQAKANAISVIQGLLSGLEKEVTVKFN